MEVGCCLVYSGQMDSGLIWTSWWGMNRHDSQSWCVCLLGWAWASRGQDKQQYQCHRRNGHILSSWKKGQGSITGIHLYESCYFITHVTFSCSLNAMFNFSLSSFSMQFHAMCDIKAGEEIFYAYTNIYLPAAHHCKKLESYGFTCACTACSHATLESDKFHGSTAKKIKIIESLYHLAMEND